MLEWKLCDFLCVCVCVRARARMCACVLRARVCVYARARVCVCARVRVGVRARVYVCVCVCARVYVYAHACVFVCVYLTPLQSPPRGASYISQAASPVLPAIPYKRDLTSRLDPYPNSYFFVLTIRAILK